MTSPLNQPRPDTDVYLDGQMTSAERAVFEQRLAADPQAAADLARQKQVDAALADLFEPGEPPALDFDAAEAPLAMPKPSRAAPNRLRLIGIAAAVLLVAAGAWALFANFGKAAGIQARAVYARLVDNNFTPEEVCTDPDKFESYMQGRTGQGLLLGSSGTSVQLVGWAYAQDPKGGRVIILMVHDRGKPVIVFIDPINQQHPIAHPDPSSGLNTFERTIDRLILHEITPHAEPGVIQHLYNPKTQSDPGKADPKKAEPALPAADPK